MGQPREKTAGDGTMKVLLLIGASMGKARGWLTAREMTETTLHELVIEFEQ